MWRQTMIGVPMKKSDEYPKREAKLRADRMNIGKDTIEVGDTKEFESEDSEHSARPWKDMWRLPLMPQTQAPESIWERWFTLLEKEVS
ncbi:hypothetical protein HAX54_020726, partial [Datura stramonium]|nr:hypothetical protein [Datura stramonium]